VLITGLVFLDWSNTGYMHMGAALALDLTQLMLPCILAHVIIVCKQDHVEDCHMQNS
jgi:hypothetical protein